MEDYIDERCPLCRYYLTDVDGLWECQEGCRGYYELDGKITIAEEQFSWLPKEHECYNSEGKLISGEKAWWTA